MDKVPVRAFSGQIIGWIENCPNGDQIAREFSGKILGKYDKQCDVTRQFSGWVVAKGNQIGLLFSMR